jgi:hypothetical protein
VLVDLVADGVCAQAVAPLKLALLAPEALLTMTIAGSPQEPLITVELWPTRVPAITITMVESLQSPGNPTGPRIRTWTFASSETEPISISDRRVVSSFADESERARFAREIARRAGWPLPVASGTDG